MERVRRVTETVGWIGAGRMGAAMVSRLGRLGVDVLVWNRTRAKAEALTDSGCQVADSIADLRNRDVVFTMVSTPADLEEVLTGPDGLLSGDTVPGAVVDCSTVSTSNVRSTTRISRWPRADTGWRSSSPAPPASSPSRPGCSPTAGSRCRAAASRRA